MSLWTWLNVVSYDVQDRLYYRVNVGWKFPFSDYNVILFLITGIDIVSIRTGRIFFFEKKREIESEIAGYVNSNNLIFAEFNWTNGTERINEISTKVKISSIRVINILIRSNPRITILLHFQLHYPNNSRVLFVQNIDFCYVFLFLVFRPPLSSPIRCIFKEIND